MIDDEVEAVARAIARSRCSTFPKSSEPDISAVSEQHRDLARLAIATLEQHRAAKDKSNNQLVSKEPDQTPVSCPGLD
ncbi:hypothetical protein [Microvirga makkahensis]|uniref:Uncharacterized protein n=1 Tax=Microvirga makkahensis TaxID=1128670 RepID=A0A7X3MUM1_9HYPH|nr:hypothetical protein [Microvirga makkahensis]MXQ13541.1 hypothetical protein [Microvirga makkahensis]